MVADALMEELPKNLTGLVTAASAVLGFVVWLVRLEGRQNYSEKELQDLRSKYEYLESKIYSELSEVKQALAHIKGILEGKLNKGE